jgi:pimeloyl-ACP methyl ester carboxylesterase
MLYTPEAEAGEISSSASMTQNTGLMPSRNTDSNPFCNRTKELYMMSCRIANRIFAVLFVLLSLPILPRDAVCQSTKPFAPTRFSVVVEGAEKGPAVLLLPGLASSRAVYDAEAALLAPSYRLYRVQPAGFAGEPAGANASGPILAPVVEELHQYIVANQLHPAVIGHSMGGLIALMLASAHPADVSKLMVVASLPFYGLAIAPAETVEMLHPQAVAVHDQMLALPAAQFDALQPVMAASLVTNAAAQKLVAASTIASDRTVYANTMLEGLTTDVRPQLAAIKTPTTVVYPYLAATDGPEEKTTALYTSSYSVMPHVTMVKVNDSRHFIMYDQPAAFHAAVVAFLK